MDNANTKEYLEKIRAQVVENLKRTAFAPSVQMTDVPRDPLVGGMDDEADAILDDEDEDENKDVRVTRRRFDQYVEKPGELSDSEDEEENAANGIRRQPNSLKSKNHFSYKHLDAGDSGLDSGLATPRDESSIADEEADVMGDAKMTEAPEVETEGPRSPSAEPPSRAEEASAHEQSEMAIDKQEEESAAPAAASTSVPVSRQPSPKVQDEDTTMEDAQPPAPEPEQPESTVPSEKQEEETKPVEEAAPSTDNHATELSSPPKSQSPAKEVSEPAGEKAEQPEGAETAEKTETVAPTESTEATTAPAATEEAKPEKAPEAPKDEPTSEKTGAEEPKATEESNNANNTEESKEASSEQRPEEPAKNEE